MTCSANGFRVCTAEAGGAGGGGGGGGKEYCSDASETAALDAADEVS